MSTRISEEKDLFALRRELAFRDLEHGYSLTIELFKWCLSTTMALNGAALVALMGSDSLRPMLLGGPGWVFVGGVVTSLAANIAIIMGMAFMGDEISNAIWRGEGFDLESFDDFAPDADNERASTIGAVLLGISILCFVGGCIWTGTSAAKPSNAPAAQQTGTKK